MFGIVQDTSGAVIPSAQIRLRNIETQRTWQTSTDESGNFRVTLLPIGTYEVIGRSQGLQEGRRAGRGPARERQPRIVFTLEVGQIAEQVDVEASTVAVNVATGTTSQLLDGKDMVNMPSRGRNVQPFALLMPGVVSTTPYDRRNNNSSGQRCPPDAQRLADRRRLQHRHRRQLGLSAGAEHRNRGGVPRHSRQLLGRVRHRRRLAVQRDHQGRHQRPARFGSTTSTATTS